MGRLARGNHHVFDPIRFHTLATERQRNDEALADTFFLSLSEEIKDRLAAINLPTISENLLDLAVKVNNLIQG